MLLYFFIGLLASIIGAISGVGGGVMLKPVLDAVSPFDTAVIGLLSAFSVLTMSLTSVVRHAVAKTKFDLKVALFLGIGAVLGGILGDTVFAYVKAGGSDAFVKTVQAALLIALLLFVLSYMNFLKPKGLCFHVKSPVWMALIGLILGMLSTFLGIGGGPINLAVLCLLFAMDLKNATINSLLVIVFSQTAKIIRTLVAGGFPADMPWTVLLLMAPAAVIGGLIGTVINRKCSEKALLIVYDLTMAAIIGINVYNIVVNAGQI